MIDLIHTASGYYATRDWGRIVGPFATEQEAVDALREEEEE